MNHLLDAITRFNLTGHQAMYASGEKNARRYAAGFSPIERGETAFLHVMGDNPGARRLYREMGFRDYCETTLRVICMS